jgi:hypothetical protein
MEAPQGDGVEGMSRDAPQGDGVDGTSSAAEML